MEANFESLQALKALPDASPAVFTISGNLFDKGNIGSSVTPKNRFGGRWTFCAGVFDILAVFRNELKRFVFYCKLFKQFSPEGDHTPEPNEYRSYPT